MSFSSLKYIVIILVLFVSLAACDDTSYQVRIPNYDEANDAYVLSSVEVETLSDINRLEGRATSIIGGAKVNIDFTKGLMFWDNPGRHASFRAIKSNEVHIPEDFDSLAMISIYYNIENAMLFMENLGMPKSLLVDMNSYYWPDLTIKEPNGDSIDTYTMTDNAFYLFSTEKTRAFFVFPFDQFQWLPMGMNAGIMTHEYTHAVFDALIYDPTRKTVVPNLLPSAQNFLYGLNEGCADYMAYAAISDADFMEHSIEKGIFTASCNRSAPKDVVRDCSESLEYTELIDMDARETAPLQFCPYDLGAFVASTLYSIALELNSVKSPTNNTLQVPSRDARERIAQVLYLTLEKLGAELRYDFELIDFFNIYISMLDAGIERDSACMLLKEQYAMYCGELTGC